MQCSSQTSQSALTRRGRGLPGGQSAGTERATGWVARAGVAVVGQGSDPDQAGIGPADVADLDPGGEIPGQARRLARVPGVLPIGMPARADVEHQGQVDGLAGGDPGPLCDESCGDIVGAHLRPAPSEGAGEQEGEEQDHQGAHEACLCGPRGRASTLLRVRNSRPPAPVGKDRQGQPAGHDGLCPPAPAPAPPPGPPDAGVQPPGSGRSARHVRAWRCNPRGRGPPPCGSRDGRALPPP